MTNSTGERKRVTYNALFNQWNAIFLPSVKANKGKEILFDISNRVIKILCTSKESIMRYHSINRQLKYCHTYSSSALIQWQLNCLDSFIFSNISNAA